MSESLGVGTATVDNDITASALHRLLSQTSCPERLQELVVLSRQLFGWFTKHEPRSIEYPWVAQACRAAAPTSVVEVGAGVSPLPVWLARQGIDVTTVDYHPWTRGLDTIATANEWGYLDYGQLHPRCQSFNADASTLELPEGFADVVFSISVIEHMPAEVRRAVLANAAPWQPVGGRLFLTVDIVGGEDALWNRDQGRVVEPSDLHGTFQDLLVEIAAVGYRVDNDRVHRWHGPHCPVDIGFVEATRR